MPYIYTNPYKSSYFAAIEELNRRKVELQFLTLRIEQLEESIRTLEPLASNDSIEPTAGLSELCAQVLSSKPHFAMTANAMLQELGLRGVNMSSYSNPLAVLHTTLTRLCKPGTGFFKGKTVDGQPAYIFNPNEMSAIYRSGMRPLSDML